MDVLSLLLFISFLMFTAVQHERAPRPAVTTQHQLALQKMGYNLVQKQTYNIPAQSPLALSNFPPLPPYCGFVPTISNALPMNAHTPFFERSLHEFTSSRHPESIPTNIPQLNPLLSTQVGQHGSYSAFKTPLFPTPLQYPVRQSGYLTANIFYPPILSTENAVSPSESKYLYFIITI